ncbi:ADP-ribosylation factor GTPase-activating protein AGD1 [Zea mays]|uniref:ADP-ribosylation factor GTPase-activating protein AGD1 n=1 Tax=Zea mays TaxID=4577 RepID=A0A1D6KUP0_MAIZE|nr:ADP-ribosylation factor GTPase-activating protein AGD1 [Zea mays]
MSSYAALIFYFSSFTQTQMRDLSGFVETRQQLLSLKPNHRMNWIGFAVAHHLNSDSSKAVEVLEAYEGTLEDDYPPENERYEHNEMLLYKMTTAISIEDVRREVKILKALSGHSNLVKFYDALSPEAKDFVKRLLNKDYRKRMTAAQALLVGRGDLCMSPVEFEPSVSDDLVLEKKSGNGQHDVRGTHHHRTSMKPEKPIDLLRKLMAIICVLTVVL